MMHIHTTATLVDKLRRQAKNIRKETRTSLGVAQEAVARKAGYQSWKHVTVCLEATRAQAQAKPTPLPPLPPLLANTLATSLTEQPPSDASKQAFSSGLVFAMDVKDAEHADHDELVVECDEAWAMAAADIWRVFVHSTEYDERSLAESTDPEEVLQFALEDLSNYRLFRYAGDPTPADLNEAFKRVLGRYFFRPAYVWLQGTFIDISMVEEVRVDGKVIYESHPHGAGRMAVYRTLPERNEPEAAAPPAEGRRAPPSSPAFAPHPPDKVCRLNVDKLEPGHYGSRLSYGGQEVSTDAGFKTIREAISSVSFDDNQLYGVEVAYQGVLVGTFLPSTLTAAPEMIAQRALETLGELGAAGR